MAGSQADLFQASADVVELPSDSRLWQTMIGVGEIVKVAGNHNTPYAYTGLLARNSQRSYYFNGWSKKSWAAARLYAAL